MSANIQAGVTVTARPWSGGSEIASQHGVVFVADFNGQYALVWFPGLGAPRVGSTVMPILFYKLSNILPLSAAADGWLRKAAALIVHADMRREWTDATDAVREAARAVCG